MNNLKFGDQIKVINDGCQGEYSDLIGQTLLVIETNEVDDGYTFIHVAGTNRKDDLMEFGEDMVLTDDCELVSVA